MNSWEAYLSTINSRRALLLCSWETLFPVIWTQFSIRRPYEEMMRRDDIDYPNNARIYWKRWESVTAWRNYNKRRPGCKGKVVGFSLHVKFRKIRLIEGNGKCHLKNGLCGRCLSVWSPEPHTPPLTHCICVYSIFIHKGKGGGGNWTRDKARGATVHKAGSKIPTWLTLSPVYKLW